MRFGKSSFALVDNRFDIALAVAGPALGNTLVDLFGYNLAQVVVDTLRLQLGLRIDRQHAAACIVVGQVRRKLVGLS